MAQWHYHYFGLQIESELHLPEWSAFEVPSFAVPDLKILWSDLSVPYAGDAVPLVTANEYCFFVPDAAEYRVKRLGEIEVCTVPSPDMEKVRVCLYGAALATFCYLSGMLILHASVVAVGDEAVAFCGQSGAGKSSLAARMTTLGYPLVSDDLCRIDLSKQGPPLVYPSSTRLKLWREALSMLDITDSNLEQDHFRMDKYHVPIAGDFLADRLPLAAVFVLDWGEPACMRLSGTEALRRLVVTATYRGDLLEAINGLARHWSACVELTRRTAVWELARPRDWSQMDAAVALVLAAAEARQQPQEEKSFFLGKQEGIS